jgi:hypothetical protein
MLLHVLLLHMLPMLLMLTLLSLFFFFQGYELSINHRDERNL